MSPPPVGTSFLVAMGGRLVKVVAKAIGGVGTLTRFAEVATYRLTENLIGLVSKGLANDVGALRANVIRRDAAKTDIEAARAMKVLAEAQEAATHSQLKQSERRLQQQKDEAAELAHWESEAKAAAARAKAAKSRTDEAKANLAREKAESQRKLIEQERLQRQAAALERVEAAFRKLRLSGGSIQIDKQDLQKQLEALPASDNAIIPPPPKEVDFKPESGPASVAPGAKKKQKKKTAKKAAEKKTAKKAKRKPDSE